MSWRELLKLPSYKWWNLNLYLQLWFLSVVIILLSQVSNRFLLFSVIFWSNWLDIHVECLWAHRDINTCICVYTYTSTQVWITDFLLFFPFFGMFILEFTDVNNSCTYLLDYGSYARLPNLSMIWLAICPLSVLLHFDVLFPLQLTLAKAKIFYFCAIASVLSVVILILMSEF